MHYKNGREAQVGDQIVGTCYNTKGLIVGTLLEITSTTSKTCNCKVAFVGDAVTPVKVDYSQCDNFHHAEDAARALALFPDLFRVIGEQRDRAYELCRLIELCGASPELTNAVVAAAKIRTELSALLP